MAIQIIQAHERTRLHAINKETSAEMIDFMLQYARVPAGRRNTLWVVIFVPEIDSAGALHQGAEASEAQTAFEKFDLFFRLGNYARIDQHLKRGLQHWLDTD